MRKSVQLSILIFLVASINLRAQLPPRFDGTVGSYEVSLSGKGFGEINDVTKDLQTLIDDVSSQPNGGTIKLSGNIQLTKIIVKSNVHIDVAKGTVIKPLHGVSNRALFEIGYDVAETIVNVKIFCSESDHTKPNDDINEKFVFDLGDYTKTDKIRMFLLQNVENFWISDYYVKDEMTPHSTLVLNPVIVQTSTDNTIHKGLRDYKVLGFPQKGDVRYIHGVKQHGGYGIVQVQTAKDVNFEHLSGWGGVTLRMESGAGVQFIGTQLERHVSITGIRGKDLFLGNGFSCVTLSPHGRINGSVTLEDVRSESSCFTVKTATGFFDSELVELDENEKKYLIDSVKFQKGRFDGPVIVKNVHAVFGTNAHGRKHEYDYIEKSLQEVYPWDDMELSVETTKTRKIPSAIAMAYLSIPKPGATPDTIEGEYLCQIDGPITSVGFPSCITTHYGNILNDDDRWEVDCSIFSSNPNINSKQTRAKIYPNPAGEVVHIEHPSDCTVRMYNNLGQLVLSTSLKSNNPLVLNTKRFPSGIYSLQLTNKINQYTHLLSIL